MLEPNGRWYRTAEAPELIPVEHHTTLMSLHCICGSMCDCQSIKLCVPPQRMLLNQLRLWNTQVVILAQFQGFGIWRTIATYFRGKTSFCLLRSEKAWHPSSIRALPGCPEAVGQNRVVQLSWYINILRPVFGREQSRWAPTVNTGQLDTVDRDAHACFLKS